MYFPIQSGAKVYTAASKEIKIGPGFTAEFGSEFNASIIADPCEGSNAETGQFRVLVENFEKIEVVSNRLDVYPNPSNDFFNLEASFGMEKREVSILVYDNKGILIKKFDYRNVNKIVQRINLENNISRLFFAKVLADDVIMTRKLLLIK